MKTFKSVFLFLLLATSARAAVAPPINITKLKGGPTNGIVKNVGGTVSELNCAANTGYVPTWTGTDFTCQALPATGVSSVTGSLPISSSGGSTPNISIRDATTSQSGALTSSDWNLFNGKQDALTFTGTGNTVRATSPTLVTPDLGTPSAGVLTNATGTASGLTAGHVTTNANLTGPITSVGNATSIAAQTGTGTTFVVQTSPVLTTPNLGTPSAGVMTNVTGTASGLTAGNVTTNANLTGPITSVGNATSVAAQTGTGTTFVMQASPTLTTPNLGTPSAGVMTNVTGTASGLTAGNVTTDANLTGPITSSGNATSIAAQTGTGTTFAMQAGPTFTGVVTMATGSVTAPPLIFGTSNTGIYSGNSDTVNITTTGVVGAEYGTGFVNLFAAKGTAPNGKNALGIFKEGSTTSALYLGWGTDYNGASAPGMDINSIRVFGFHTDSAGCVNFNPTQTSGIDCKYLTEIAINTAVSSPVLTGATPPTSADPMWTSRNLNSTASNLVGGVKGVGSSSNAIAALEFYAPTQTSSSEDAKIKLSGRKAGTWTTFDTWFNTGHEEKGGTQPTIGTCGTSPSMVSGGSDNGFKINTGTGGSATTCAVTLATAWTTGGHCDCTDDTTSGSFVLRAVLSSTATVTITSYSATLGTAAAFTASDVFSCGCHFW